MSMEGSVRIARVFGIPIEIHYTWLIVFGLVAWSLATGYFPRAGADLTTAAVIVLSVGATLLFFAALLVHELAHAYVAMRGGLPVRRITLFIFGGVAQMEREPRTASGEFRMAIAGPLTSLVIAGAAWAAARASGGGLRALFQYLALINAAVALFNMVPAFPLDGGRVFRAAVWWATKSLSRATRVASLVGQGFAYLFMLLGVLQIFTGRLGGGLWLVFIGWFLLQAAQAGYQQVLIRRALRGVKVREVMREEIAAVPPGISLTAFVQDYLLRAPTSEFCVMDDGRLRGLISLDDVKRVPREQWDAVPVAQVMTPEEACPVVSASQSAYDAFLVVASSPTGQAAVRDGDRLVGAVTQRDLLAHLRTRLLLNP